MKHASVPFSIAVVLFLGFAGAAVATSSVSPTGLSVSGTADRFEVFTEPGTGGSEIFCAAGDFAARRLGARGDDRVVVTGGRAPSATRPNRRSVTFRVTGPDRRRGVFAGDVLLRVGQTGQSRSVGGARGLCNIFP